VTDPIRKTLHVPLRPKTAFELFTENLDAWWPTDSHSLSAGDGEVPQDVKIDKKVGGHITETKADGEQGRWGTITRWEPGRAVGVSWYVGRDESEATDVTVVFTPTDTGTMVELTHDGFERLGDVAVAMHGNYTKGWDYVLIGKFGQFCSEHKLVINAVT
jgi:hypothetical protein